MSTDQIGLARVGVKSAREGTPLPARFHRGLWIWFWLGFTAVMLYVAPLFLTVL